MDRVPLLVGVSGPLSGQRFRVTPEGLVVGRSPDCDVPIPDQGVSREHARVLLHNAAVWVQDAGSRNGVYVNGKRITRHKQLSPGAELTIGQHGFTLELTAPEDAPPATESRGGDAASRVGDAAGLLDSSKTVDLDAPTSLGIADLDRVAKPTSAPAATDDAPDAPEEGRSDLTLYVLVGVLGLALMAAAVFLYFSN